MANGLDCEYAIAEWQIRNIEGGVVNVGQSWQQKSSTGVTAADPGLGEFAGAARGAGDIGPTPSRPAALPQDLNQLVAQVQWLQCRLDQLETLVRAQRPEAQSTMPRRVEFKIQKLYVRELTGTLNIGLTSIHDGPFAWSAPSVALSDEDEQDWRRLEQEGDEQWFTDVP